MKRVISPIEVRDKLGQILEEAYYSGRQFVIARRGKPMAAIVPISEYEKWEKDREDFFELVDTVWEANRETDAEKLAEDIASAIQDIRSKR